MDEATIWRAAFMQGAKWAVARLQGPEPTAEFETNYVTFEDIEREAERRYPRRRAAS